jgi:hypothetical protein
MSTPLRVKTDHQKAIVKIFESLRYRHSPWTVWSDFVAMAACTLSQIDTAQRDERERMYSEIAKKYSTDELTQFADMFGIVVDALEYNPNQDFLGELFMMLELGNDHNGQFFTPYCICEMMARMSGEQLPYQIKEKGYISVNDCACGAGALLIAFANEARRLEVNHQMHIEFVAQDIDFTAAMMCYIQLSLLGCPGYIIVGNTLTTPPTESLSNQNVWYTPLYFHEVWRWRRVLKAIKSVTGKHENVIKTDINVAGTAEIVNDTPKIENDIPKLGFLQLSLFDEGA